MCGFVCFKRFEDARKAAETLHGKDGLYVVKALKKEERKKEVDEFRFKLQMQTAKTNVYVKYIPNNAIDEDVYEFLSRFGKIVSHRVRRDQSIMDKTPFGVSAFASYLNAEMAYKALKEGPEEEFMGRRLYFNKWEAMGVRKAHLDEVRDSILLIKRMGNWNEFQSRKANGELINFNFN